MATILHFRYNVLHIKHIHSHTGSTARCYGRVMCSTECL